MSNEATFDPVTDEHLKESGHRPCKQVRDLLEHANAMQAAGWCVSV